MANEKIDEKAIFNIARQINSPEARREYLGQVCGADSELLARLEILVQAYAEQSSFLEKPLAHGLSPTIDQPLVEKAGTVIGPYKLLQQIGEGGMGVVYMAEQSKPIARMVALKIIKPGMDTQQVVARFEAERQALAMMDHPNIAKVLDAGATDSGRPYFVMELVRGIPITDYCDEHRLTPKYRLELFIQVLHAVQHAHQKGIIHRDIKPSNVLVAEYDHRAVPKVIDFGVAKATTQKLTDKTMFTQFGQLVGTFEYMSPEQAKLNQMDIDTRSDIYSLGVLLYELLTGETPFDRSRLRSAAFDELLRIIREDEPPIPSTRLTTSASLVAASAKRGTEPKKLGTLIRGELDWIVMKAIDKERARRYETPNAFAEDIQRFLNQEAVAARPASAAYRLKKFYQRNRASVWTGSAIAATLVLGICVSTFMAIQARSSNQVALKSIEQLQHSERTVAEERDAQKKLSDELTVRNKELLHQKEEQRRLRYVSDMNLVRTASESSDIVQINSLLFSHRPQLGESDLRGFEWHYWNRAIHSELRSVQLELTDSEDSVLERSVLTDNNRLIELKNGNMIVWDTQTGKKISQQVAIGSNGSMFTAGAAKNGTRVAIKSACDSEKKHPLLIIFDPNTGSQIRSIPLPENDISLFSAPSLTDDGKLVAAVSSNGHLQVWSVETGENLFAETIPDAMAGFLQFDQRGTTLAGTFFLPDNRRVTKVFRLADGQLLGTMDSAPSKLAFSPDGNLLALSSYGGDLNGNRLEVFDVSANCNLLWSIPKKEPSELAPHFSGDGRWLACCVGKGVRTFSSRSGAESHLIWGHAAPIEALGFRENSSNLVTVDSRGVLKEWQSLDDQFDNKTISLDQDSLVMSDEWTQPNDLYVRHPKTSGKIGEAEIDEKEQQAIVGDMTGRVLMRVPTAGGRVFGASIDRDGRHIAVVDFSLNRPTAEAACVRVFDLGSQRELSRIFVRATLGGVGSHSFLPLLILSPDGNLVAVSSTHPDHSRKWIVELYNSRTGQRVMKCEDSNNEPWRYLRWSPCGRWLAGAFDENVLRTRSSSTTPTHSTFVRIWSAETGKMLWERRTPGCDFFRFADQGELAFGIEIRSSKPWFLVWDIKSGEEVHSVALPERLSADNPAYFAIFDKLTQRAFVAQRTGFGSNIVDLLDLSGPGRVTRTFEPVTLGRRSSISLAVAPDGKRLATSEVNFIGSSGGQTQLWDTESGKVLLTIPFAASRLEFNKAKSELYGRRFDSLPGLLYLARWNATPLAPAVEAR